MQYFCGDQLLRKGLLPASIERSDICIGGEILLPPLDKLPNRIFPTDNAILKQTVVEHATFYMHMQSFFWHGQPRIAELVFFCFFGDMFGCGGGVKLIPRPNFSSTSSLAGDLNLSTYSATRVHVEDRKCQTFRYYPQHIAHSGW